MQDPITPPARTPSRTPYVVAAAVALVAVQGAAWLYFRARQPATDAQTRERLQPRDPA